MKTVATSLLTALLSSAAAYPAAALVQNHPAAAPPVAPGSPIDANTVKAFGGTTSRTLSARAAEHSSVRDFGAACDGVTDDSTVLAAAVNTLATTKRGTTLDIPGDCRIRLGGASQVWLRDIHIEGPGTKELGSQGYTYGREGGTIIVDTPTLANGGVSPFVVSSDWSLIGLKFYWPGQTEYTVAAAGATAAAGGAIPFAPLLSAHGAQTDIVNFFSFSDNQVENAYDIADFTKAATAQVGHYHWERNSEFALHYHIHVAGEGGEAWISNNQFSLVASLYLNSGTNTAGPAGAQSFYLRTFASLNSEIIHVDGSGTATVDGLRFSNNYALGMRYGLRAQGGGGFNISELNDNGFDEVSTVLAADTGAGFYSVTVSGGSWLCESLAKTVIAPCLSINGRGAYPSANRLSLVNVKIPVVTGPGIVFHDTKAPSAPTDGNGAPTLSIVGGELLNIGNVGSGNPYTGIDFNAPAGSLTLVGFPLTTVAAAQTSAQAITIEGAKSFVAASLTFGGWNIPLVINTTTGSYSLVGSSSYGTTARSGTATILGPGKALVSQAGNTWDKWATAFSVPPTSLKANSNSNVEQSTAVDNNGHPQTSSRLTDVLGRYNLTVQGAHYTFGSTGIGLPAGSNLAIGSSAGVSCKGAPTSSYAVVGGIVTHC